MTGAELRGIRDRLGLRQADLAELIGVTRNTVARWERDEVPIREPMARLNERLASEHGATTRRREGKAMKAPPKQRKGGR